jgi:hypothetical protein
VEGPPGTGKSQTIANLIASLAAHGRRTLFVAEMPAAIDAVLERLNGLGLGDLVLDLHDGASSRRRIAQDFARALSVAGNVPLTIHAENHGRLERRRDHLRAWRDALHRRREPWNLNVYEVQAELIDLRRTETIAVRVGRETTTALGEDAYQGAAVDFEEFAERAACPARRFEPLAARVRQQARDERRPGPRGEERRRRARRADAPRAQAELDRVAHAWGCAARARWPRRLRCRLTGPGPAEGAIPEGRGSKVSPSCVPLQP